MNISLPPKFKNIFDPYRFKVYYGGRSSSKSWSVSIYLLLKAMEAKKLILNAREFQASIKDSSKALIENQIQRLGLNSFFTSTNNEITGVNGSRFIFKGLKVNPDSIKGTEDIDIVWCEEAQNLSKKSLGFLIPTVRKPGSEFLFTFNPYLITDPVYDEFITHKRPNSLVEKVNYFDNPYLSEESREEVEWCKKRDIHKYNHVWLGEPVSLVDEMVFKNWEIKDFDRKRHLKQHYGLDFGFSNDPTALIEASVDEEHRVIYVENELYQIGVEIDYLPVWMSRIFDAKKNIIYADDARPETISYLNKHGYSVRKAYKGHNSVIEGVEFINSYDVVIHPRCVNTIYEFSNYRFKKDIKTDVILPVLVDKNNHICDALRYALFHNNRPELKIYSLGDF